MQALVFFVLGIGFFASIAGLIYPFKPFGTRKRALVSFVVCTVAVGFLAPETEQLNDPNNALSGKLVEDRTASSTSSAEIQIEKTPARSPSAPSEKEIRDVWLAFDTQNWVHTAHLITVMKNKGYSMEGFLAELEEKALAAVKPLPASEYDLNLSGYQLLAAIRPENESYQAKITQYQAGKEAARQRSISRLRTKTDKVEGVTWYQHPNAPKYLNSRSTVYLYIGRRGENGKPWLRMKVQYTASKWLFVHNVVAWHDGIKEPLISGRFERDHNATIWEWQDAVPEGYQIEVLRSLANANEAILRFEGDQYHKDVTLSVGDKKALREVLSAYEAMKTGD
ncbi:MAG: hypothetical protein CSA70_00350 [Rhodobacterales bacterium]|nr:MAG: hypothetical protein CSA70_00350 [Rhodobacterales bacterium]